MSAVISATEIEPVILHFGPFMQRMSDHEFYDFCRRNQDWRIERTAEGDLLIMSPTGGGTGHRNATLTRLFGNWVEADGSGLDFDSSTTFSLPNGAQRSPDVSWVRRERWEALSEDEREEFPPLCPDFIIELRSRSDPLKMLRQKMQEYLEQGTQLGWLIDPFRRKVHIYRPDHPVEILDQPESVSGDPLLPGLTLPLAKIWRS
ncbi:MAG TPA: Uma2 family endonuclease [Blastocatellia bacterium]|nr:Uma2 family endonuclease [Blastocatellia bacterium]